MAMTRAPNSVAISSSGWRTTREDPNPWKNSTGVPSGAPNSSKPRARPSESVTWRDLGPSSTSDSRKWARRRARRSTRTRRGPRLFREPCPRSLVSIAANHATALVSRSRRPPWTTTPRVPAACHRGRRFGVRVRGDNEGVARARKTGRARKSGRPEPAAAAASLTGPRPFATCSLRSRVGFIQTRSKRSAFMTFVQAATKSFTNFSALSSWA